MELQQILAELSVAEEREKIEQLLQDTLQQLLCCYKISVCGIDVFPIEVESYFYRQGIFEDPYVHSNELQMNHFGELYIHRRGRRSTDPYKMDNRVCMGISLSTADTYYYSALVRSALFADGTSLFGPNTVLTHLMQQVNAQTGLLDAGYFTWRHAGTFELSKLFPLVEHQRVLQPTATSVDPRDKTYLLQGPRIGLGPLDAYYRELPLRQCAGRLSKEFAFKEKTELLHRYLASHCLSPEEAKQTERALKAPTASPRS